MIPAAWVKIASAPTAIALPGFKRPDTTVRRPAVLAVVKSVAVNEKREMPTINLNGHEAVIGLIA
jgi:hypothetical protein